MSQNLVYRTNDYICSFKSFRTISTFGRNIYNDTITVKEADKGKSSLLVKILSFKSKIKSQNTEKEKRKKVYLRIYMPFLKVEYEFLMLLKAEYFQ